MLLARRYPDPVTGADRLDGATSALDQTAARDDQQCLTQGMLMPMCPRPGREGDHKGYQGSGLGGVADRILPHGAGEIFTWRGLGRGRTGGADLHGDLLLLLKSLPDLGQVCDSKPTVRLGLGAISESWH